MIRTLVALGFAGLIVLSAKNLPASFYYDELHTSVQIDGVDYGTFSEVAGLQEGLTHPKKSADENYRRITLQRGFVTEPSLYLWAKNNVSQRQGLKDIHLVRKNSEGEEVDRYVLKLCQPLSWTVEAANHALGGFHETVDLAVQEISVY